MVMKGGYGFKISTEYLGEAIDKAKSMGTVIYTDEIPDMEHVIVSCDFPPRSTERKEYDDFLRLLYLREKMNAPFQ
jgi:hypothetical protein